MGSQSKKLLAFAKRTYQRSPFCFRWLFSSIVIIYRLIYRLNYKLRINVWILSGTESAKVPLTIIFAGTAHNKEYFAKLAFNNFYTEKYLGKAWRWNLMKRINKMARDCSLMVLEVNTAFYQAFGDKKSFFIPRWIGQEADISVNTSSFNRHEKQINKHNLRFEVTNDRNQFDKFYQDMYVPYITKVFGNTAILMSYYEMEKNFKNGILLLVKRDEEFIAGEIIVYEKNGPRLAGLGIKNGNTDYLKTEVMLAIYFFAIKYLRQEGYNKLHFGSSRAFLKDGVLQYKKRWRLQVVDDKNIGFLIKPLCSSDGAKEFFLKNPFIYLDQGVFCGAIFLRKDQLHSRADLEKIYKDYYEEGLSKVNVYLYGNGERIMGDLIPPELHKKMSICSAESLFQT